MENKKEKVLKPKVQEQKVQAPKKSRKEIKDKVYELLQEKPIVYIARNKAMYWFDEELGYEREIKYTENQKTVFVDEFKGDVRYSHIVFRDGFLYVPKEKQILQELLSNYHPDRDVVFKEIDTEKEAVTELSMLEIEMEALDIARSLDVDQMEAILRTEVGSKVTKMKSNELKRDLILFAKDQPELFIELANDDQIKVRNMGIKAVEEGIISLSSDQRTFTWSSNGRKLLTVPFEEHPYSALASWFKTDEGLEVYSSIEKKLK